MANGISFSGTEGDVDVRQTASQWDDPKKRTDLTFALTIERPGLRSVSGRLRVNLNLFERLSGAVQAAREAAVRRKLIERLAENWHDFSFVLGWKNGEPILDDIQEEQRPARG